MNSPSEGPLAGAVEDRGSRPVTARPRVGRLVPLPGVVLRVDPERATVQSFLQSFAVPMAAMRTALEVAAEAVPVGAGGLAIGAAVSHRDHLSDLIADFNLLGSLEQDLVAVEPSEMDVAAWHEAVAQHLEGVAARFGSSLCAEPRSFLPSAVQLDDGLALRAIDAVMRVAAARCQPGRIDLALTYQDATGPHGARLVFELSTKGGGFVDVELGYVFRPFSVQDAAARPQLGLSIAQRLCELLGGELRVLSSGPSLCHYRVAFAAPPAEGAHWRDPLAPQIDLGPIA